MWLNHGFAIETMEVAPDHGNVFLSFQPRYSISKVVGILNSVSAGVIFHDHPEVKKHLWGGESWKDGHFTRTTGDRVTADVVRTYAQYNHDQETPPTQLEVLFRDLDAPSCGRGDSPPPVFGMTNSYYNIFLLSRK